MDWITVLVTLIGAFLTSSGFWAYINSQNNKHDNKTKLLIGLGHDRIIFLGMKYIERGWITEDEYENIHDYLYIPYKEAGGNGSAERIMAEVQKLPIHEIGFKGGQIDEP